MSGEPTFEVGQIWMALIDAPHGMMDVPVNGLVEIVEVSHLNIATCVPLDIHGNRTNDGIFYSFPRNPWKRSPEAPKGKFRFLAQRSDEMLGKILFGF